MLRHDSTATRPKTTNKKHISHLFLHTQQHYFGSTTDTDMNNPLSIDEEIANEERLIQIYESELEILQRQQRQQLQQREASGQLQDDDEEEADASGQEGEDPLDFILQQEDEESTISSLHASLAAFQQDMDQDHHRLQPIIRGFCFTSVRRRSATGVYTMRGNFVTYPSICARIQVTFTKTNDTTETSPEENANLTAGDPEKKWKGRRKASSATIRSLKCELDLPDDQEAEWRWLEREVKARKEDLASWMEAVGTYLEFHKKRYETLAHLQELYPSLISIENHHSKVVIHLKGSQGDEKIVSFLWGWKWKEGRDVLRLTQSSLSTGRLTVGQPHLDSLLQICGDDCGEAVELLLQQINLAVSGKGKLDRRGDPPEGYEGEDDDEVECSDSNSDEELGRRKRARMSPAKTDRADPRETRQRSKYNGTSEEDRITTGDWVIKKRIKHGQQKGSKKHRRDF